MIYSEYDKRILPLVFLAIVAVALILGFLLRHRSQRVRAIPTAVVAVALLFIEAVKQRWNLLGEFDPFNLPLHYCSLFLLLLPLAELCGARCSRIFRPTATCMAFMVSVATYVYPRGIMGEATELFGISFKETHGFIFHHLVLLYLLLVITLRLSRPRIRDAVFLGLLGVLYVAAVLPIAQRLETNYCNFLESVIPIVENFRLNYGQRVYTILISLSVTVGAVGSGMIYIGISTALNKLWRLFLRGRGE